MLRLFSLNAANTGEHENPTTINTEQGEEICQTKISKVRKPQVKAVTRAVVVAKVANKAIKADKVAGKAAAKRAVARAIVNSN